MARTIQGKEWTFASADWKDRKAAKDTKDIKFPHYADYDSLMSDVSPDMVLAVVNRYLEDLFRNDANSVTAEPKTTVGKLNRAIRENPDIIGKLPPELQKLIK